MLKLFVIQYINYNLSFAQGYMQVLHILRKPECH